MNESGEPSTPHDEGDHSKCDSYDCEDALCWQLIYVGGNYDEPQYCENPVEPFAEHCAVHNGD